MLISVNIRDGDIRDQKNVLQLCKPEVQRDKVNIVPMRLKK